MKYKGYVFSGAMYLRSVGLDPKEPHYFKLIGFWIGNKNQRVGSYVLSDENGKALEGLEYLQFSRTRDNEFYLESLG